MSLREIAEGAFPDAPEYKYLGFLFYERETFNGLYSHLCPEMNPNPLVPVTEVICVYARRAYVTTITLAPWRNGNSGPICWTGQCPTCRRVFYC